MIYKTLQGKEIDMEKLMRQHELTPAVGNQKVNARGDELGEGGKIVKRREEVMKEYYEGHPESKPTPRPQTQPITTTAKKNKEV